MVVLTIEQEGYEPIIIECEEVEENKMRSTFKFGESGTGQYEGALIAAVASDVIQLLNK